MATQEAWYWRVLRKLGMVHICDEQSCDNLASFTVCQNSFFVECYRVERYCAEHIEGKG